MATYYVKTDGDDGKDGLSEANAWQTIDHAMNQVAAGDTVYVKTGTYAETAIIDTAGTSNSPIVIEGYKTTPGDEGDGEWVVIDGEGTRTSGITRSITGALYYVIRHVRATGHAGTGFDLSSCMNFHLENCRSDYNSGTGFDGVSSGSTFQIFAGCRANNNGSAGFRVGANAVLWGCSAFSNSGQAMVSFSGNFAVVGCLIYDCNAVAIQMITSMGPGIVAGCIIDGCNGASSTGIYSLTGTHFLVLNNIFCRLNVALDSLVDCGGLRVVRNNLFYGNTADRNHFPEGFGNIYSDPQFVDADNGDYRLQAGSPAKGVGYPQNIQDLKQFVDIGALQRREMGANIGGPVNVGMQI